MKQTIIKIVQSALIETTFVNSSHPTHHNKYGDSTGGQVNRRAREPGASFSGAANITHGRSQHKRKKLPDHMKRNKRTIKGLYHIARTAATKTQPASCSVSGSKECLNKAN